MSVHDTQHYVQIKGLLGIPPDEPIFILRGKDVVAENAIADYMHRYVFAGHMSGVPRDELEEMVTGLLGVIDEFQQFKRDYPQRLKFPD